MCVRPSLEKTTQHGIYYGLLVLYVGLLQPKLSRGVARNIKGLIFSGMQQHGTSY